MPVANNGLTRVCSHLHQILIWCLASYGIRFTYYTIVESTHLYNVKITNAPILRNLIIEELAQRGYLLTGSQKYLDAYKNGRERAQIRLDQLTNLIQAEKQNEAELPEVGILIQRKETSMAETVKVENPVAKFNSPLTPDHIREDQLLLQQIED